MNQSDKWLESECASIMCERNKRSKRKEYSQYLRLFCLLVPLMFFFAYLDGGLSERPKKFVSKELNWKCTGCGRHNSHTSPSWNGAYYCLKCGKRAGN